MNLIKLLIPAFLLASCGLCRGYDPRGTSIPEDIKTISIDFFNNEAQIVNPQLSLNFTEKLKTKFQGETRLKLVNSAGDYRISGAIKDYRVEPATRNTNTGTAQNQLTISVRVVFECPLYPKKNFSRDYSFFRTYDASKPLNTVEADLSSEISDNIVQQIFASIALDW